MLSGTRGLPVCSPDALSVMLGRSVSATDRPRRWDEGSNTLELWPGATTLPDVLAPDYTDLLGKWHCAWTPRSGPPPVKVGFSSSRQLSIPGSSARLLQLRQGIDARSTHSTPTTPPTSSTTRWSPIPSCRAWFTWLAFQRAARPFHKPPPNLHTFTLPPNVSDDVPLQ